MSHSSAPPADSPLRAAPLRLAVACAARCVCGPGAETSAAPSADGWVRLPGGDAPEVRARVLAAVALLRGTPGREVEVRTCGGELDPHYASELAAAGVTTAWVRLHAHTAEHHDALAGEVGAFARCVQGVEALQAVGIRVVLNPVLARRTQQLLGGYARFVAQRLPQVRRLALSAMRPGAAGGAEAPLDFERLGPAVVAAREVAAGLGIELVNPLDGLPACVGWAHHLAQSTEAAAARAGVWRSPPKASDAGGRTHGPVCHECALRPACAGAWPEQWTQLAGQGLRPPERLAEPWAPADEDEPQFQKVVRGFALDVSQRLAALDSPTRWLWTDEVLPSTAALPFTHLALELWANRLPVSTLKQLPGLGRPVHVALRVGREPGDLAPLLVMLQSLGVVTVCLLGGGDAMRQAEALHGRFPALNVRSFLS